MVFPFHQHVSKYLKPLVKHPNYADVRTPYETDTISYTSQQIFLRLCIRPRERKRTSRSKKKNLLIHPFFWFSGRFSYNNFQIMQAKRVKILEGRSAAFTTGQEYFLDSACSLAPCSVFCRAFHTSHQSVRPSQCCSRPSDEENGMDMVRKRATECVLTYLHRTNFT